MEELIERLRPFTAKPNELLLASGLRLNDALTKVVRCGSTLIATDNKVMAIAGSWKVAEGQPCYCVDTGEEVAAYPRWEKVLPPRMDFAFAVYARELSAFLRAYGEVFDGVVLTVKRGSVRIQADVYADASRFGRVKFRLFNRSSCLPKKIQARFDSRLLVKAFDAIQSPTVGFYYQQGDGYEHKAFALIAYTPIENDLSILVMPQCQREEGDPAP